MDPLSIIASVITVLDLCGKVIGYIATAKGATKDRSRLKAEILSCQSLLEALKDETEDSDGSDDWANIIKTLEGAGAPLNVLEETLGLLVLKLGPKKNLQKVVKVLMWPFEEKDVSKVLEVIERQKSSLIVALENNNRKLAQKIASQVSENVAQLADVKKLLGAINDSQSALKQSHQDEKSQKILNWISPIYFGYRHQAILKERGEGTGTWILKIPHFVEWTEGKVKTIWCHGIPGAGKTVMAAIVSEYLRTEYVRDHPNISVATLYCDYQKQDEQSLDNLERSIFQQVVECLPTIPDAIQQIYKKALGNPPPPPDVSQLRSAFESSATSLSTVFVVLDALDEAGERVQDHIVREISELPFPDVRLFCTSRPFPRFDELFHDSPKIEIRATDEDIRAFVKAQIEERSRLHKLVKKDQKLQEDIVAKIIEKAEGMFLMARLHIDSVATGASKTNIRQALQSLPSGINNTYKQTMKRIRSQPDHDTVLAERALSWVFCSHRQLSIIELQHGLAVVDMAPGGEEVTEDDLPHEDIIISVCQGLLIQERKGYEKAFIRPVHYTAAEYFNKAYVEEFPHGQAEIATTCVAYLSLSRLSNNLSSYLSELEKEHEEDEVAYHYGGTPLGPKSNPWKYRPVIQDCFPLFFYAGEHWGSHLCEAHLLGLPISTSNIFWQYRSTSFKWAYWLVPPETSYHTKYGNDIYRIVSKSHGAVLTVLEQFTKKDHDVNAVDDDGRTMLFCAVNAGHEDAINFLLALDDIEINEPDSESNDPLSAAIGRDLKSVVRSLLSKIAVRGKEDSDEHQEAGQDSKRPRGFYSPERLRSLQVKASRMWSSYGTEVLRMLLDKTKDFDPQDGRAFLLLAIEKGSPYNSEFLTFLLERDLDLQARDESGNTVLHMAAKKNERFLVEELLRQGADAGAVNSAGWTPLQTAMDAGSFFVFLQLLKSSTAEMRRNLKFDEESSSWSEKDEKKEIERRVISLLIQEEFTSTKDPEGRTALSWAAEYATYESPVAMGFLLELDWDINSCDHSGRTALSYAAANEDYQAKDLVKKLLEAGADLGIKDNLGKTPILHAAEHSSYYVYGVISELLKAGADANAKDVSGTVVLEHIVAFKYFARRDTSQMIEELLDAGMDPNIKNSSGKTALFSMVDKVYKADDDELRYAQDILWTLLAAGADPNIKDADGKTLRDYALDRADPSLSVILLIRECLKLGGDVNSKDASGKTPLFYVAESQIDTGVQVRMVKALLDAGADPNIQDDTSRTPIFAAGDNDVWEALEKGGAKLDIKDTSGRRPYFSRRWKDEWY